MDESRNRQEDGLLLELLGVGHPGRRHLVGPVRTGVGVFSQHPGPGHLAAHYIVKLKLPLPLSDQSFETGSSLIRLLQDYENKISALYLNLGRSALK